MRERRHAARIANDADDLRRRRADAADVGRAVPRPRTGRTRPAPWRHVRPTTSARATAGRPIAFPECGPARLGEDAIDVDGCAQRGEPLAHLSRTPQAIVAARREEGEQGRILLVDEYPSRWTSVRSWTAVISMPGMNRSRARRARRRAISPHAATVSWSVMAKVAMPAACSCPIQDLWRREPVRRRGVHVEVDHRVGPGGRARARPAPPCRAGMCVEGYTTAGCDAPRVD